MDSTKENKKEIHIKNLKNVFSFSQFLPSHICIIANREVKDRTTTTISHIWQNNVIIYKPKMHTTSITSTEAEIMSMCLGLEQVLETADVKKTTIITDAIHSTKKLFNAL